MVVEKLVEPIFGEQVKINLVKPAFRITYIHFPLILASFVNWLFYKICRIYWLAVLVVGSEFLIVLSRFIFSYEQAFQGDLVRFWYAALYLFASARPSPLVISDFKSSILLMIFSSYCLRISSV